MVAASYIGWFFIKSLRPDMMNFTIFALLLASGCILDVVWLILYWSNWWNEPYIDASQHRVLRMWVLVAQIVTTVLSAIAAFYCFSLSANEKIIHRSR